MNLHKRVYTTLRSEGGEAEDRRQKSEVGRQKTEDRSRKSEDRSQKSEVRRQKVRGLEGWRFS